MLCARFDGATPLCALLLRYGKASKMYNDDQMSSASHADVVLLLDPVLRQQCINFRWFVDFCDGPLCSRV